MRIDPLSTALAFALSSTLVLGGAGGVPAAHAQDLSQVIRNRLEAAEVTGHHRVAGDRIHAVDVLPAFYLERDFRPVWITQSGAVRPLADSLLLALQRAESHGLDGADYHGGILPGLRNAAARGEAEAGDLVDLEFTLTDAFLVYGSHLLVGRVDPERVDAAWLANRRGADLTVSLREALRTGRVGATLEGLAPRQPEYGRLRDVLRDLKAARRDGGWTTVGAGPTLREGDESPRVAALRQRLLVSTDHEERRLAGANRSDGDLFDGELALAVASFQRRHGLDADGVVGARTLEALDVPVEDRILQVEVNLERWRWLPEDLGERHIRVNIAAFETQLWDRGAVVLTLRSIVGREYRMTPVFSESMRYLVLAPYWHVPPNIAAVDKLPEIQRDVSYLERLQFDVLDAATNEPVPPRAVDWSALTGAEFNRRYRLRQEPGPLNALGRVKFMFPNRYSVYLHDTPQQELFQRTRRDFSSGCIRVENPMELARLLLSDDPNWTPERIASVVAGGVERTVNLPAPVPVHLLYLTAFVDEEGSIHFRDDLYGRDPVVRSALHADPPAFS